MCERRESTFLPRKLIYRGSYSQIGSKIGIEIENVAFLDIFE